MLFFAHTCFNRTSFSLGNMFSTRKTNTSKDFRFLVTIFHQYPEAAFSTLTSVKLGCILQSINFTIMIGNKFSSLVVHKIIVTLKINGAIDSTKHGIKY